MSSTSLQPLPQTRIHFANQKYLPLELTSNNMKNDGNNEKGIILNAIADEDALDQELMKKKNQNKQRYRRLKQKLNSLCGEHQEKSLIKNGKEVSSPNKSRLLTLAIQFEKITLNQTKDYIAVESKLKEILKILDLKREHDLFILRQSRFVPALAALLKKVPTFHKNQFSQSIKSVQLGLKVLRIFCTLSANRDYMICTNQLSTLHSCLSSFIGKQQRKLAIQCLNILHQLLCSKIKSESQQIINVTLQIVFYGQIARRIRLDVENCITDDGLVEQQYVLKCLKYLYIIYRKGFEKYLERPLYQQPEIPQIMQYHLDSLLTQLQHMLSAILLEKQQGCLRDEEPPICILNISLLILKLINLCAHVNFRLAQKTLEISPKNPFWQAIQFLFYYSKQNIDNSTDNHEIKCIYSEIIDLLGRVCCQSEQNRKALASTALLEMLYNHPIVYIMDPKLKSLLIPTLCSAMDQSQVNMKKYLSQNSAQNIVNYVLTQKKRYEQLQKMYMSDDPTKQIDIFQQQQIQQQKASTRVLTRKQSVSSLNSYTTQCTQNSCLPIGQQDRYNTGLYFLVPYTRWQTLIEQLRTLDG